MNTDMITPEILERLAYFGSATAQNAGVVVRGFVPESVDYTGPALQCYLPGQQRATVGFAVTAKITTVSVPDTIIDWDVHYDQVADAPGPVMIVFEDVDGGRGAALGDVMSHRYRALGGVGVVIEGSVRDVAGIAQVPAFGVWATGRVPGHGPNELVATACDVTVAGLAISAGDLLVADADGVTRVPLDEAEAIVRACAEVEAKERAYHQDFAKPGFSKADHDAWKRRVGEAEH